ncbi:FMN-binding glutamate synthase family protein [Acidihalobacter ferrooxydans]|uniref:FMN-binding glutamate synthase family protein n=1 Tax=Acidihalobacter ferrooxydans TaxID=1765967 RepID=A0A1P8UIC1_9GAMM|nr:FMN-binding glutamate synthase family protein [Acidihalobacter ferrooxydans]APZ43579.1 FMN-binding glutamate synthase family protein [Acidihalobacter ferrooxydans]
MSATGSVLRSFVGANGLKRAAFPALALLLALSALVLSVLVSLWWLLALAFALALLGLGLHDMWQQRSALLANYPVAARFRWLALDLRPFFRAYMVEDDEEGKPYSYEARRLVYERAERASSTHPFGTELDPYAEEFVWISHSMAPVAEPEKDPRVRIGSEQAGSPYAASVFNISAMSFGALSANAIEALNLGAKRGGFYHDTGEGGISPYHLKHGGDLVWELGSGYFGARDAKGRFDPAQFAEQAQRDSVRMTEIKLSQGAKPGHGGLLPAAKVTPEIADTRKVPMHQDCLSPRGHAAFSTPVEMLEFAARMRERSGGKPVGIKFCVGQPHEVMAVMKAMRETGILLDYIVVDGAEGGTGAAPLELSNSVGMPLQDGLIVVRNALVGSGLHQQVRLAASGKLYSGAGLAECLAIGADWGNAARSFLFSIGCIQAQRCHTGTCPTGITTQDPARMRGLDPEVQGQRAANFQSATVEALMEIVAAAGLEHPRDLRPHHVHHRISASKSLPLDHIWEFLPANALLDAPEETAYARWWEAADPHSFRPRIDLGVARARAPGIAEADY